MIVRMVERILCILPLLGVCWSI